MELQLNIKTGDLKHKLKQKKGPDVLKNSKSDYAFIPKPVMDGKTIARVRNKPPDISKNNPFSFLSKKEPEKIIRSKKERVEIKHQRITTVEDSINNTEEIDKNVNFDLSMNIKNIPVKKKKKNNSNPPESTSIRNSESNEIHRQGGNPKSEPKKRTIESHISSLFRNNPDIPKLGQRFVKPISEKVFSGKNFQDLNVHDFSVANLEKNMGLNQLTVVQQKACPVILKGRDVLVRSQTGSGKTLAYALPIVEALQAIRPKLRRQDGIKALVIVPTRELALQTYELFIKLVRPFTWIVPGYLIGGEKRKAEKARIRKGFNVLIGTPGRICDHIQHTASLSLGKIRCLVLDEADRLLDMGYEKDVSSIVESLKKHHVADKYDPMAMVRESVKKNHLYFKEDQEKEDKEQDVTQDDGDEKKEEEGDNVEYKHNLSNVLLSDKRQTILLSATLTKAVETLAGLTLEDPVFIDASEGRATLIADSLANQAAAKNVTKAQKSNVKDIEQPQNKDVEMDFEIVPQDESVDEKNNPEESESNSEGSESDNEGSESDNESSENDNEGSESDNEDLKSDDENSVSDNEVSKIDNDDSESDNEDLECDDNDGSESGDDSTEAESSDDEHSEEIDKSELKTYKGLTAFAGFKPDKKEKTRNKKASQNKETSKEKDNASKTKECSRKRQFIEKATDGGSDSDSDYDFFAVSKVDIKEEKKAKKESSRKKRDVAENSSENVEMKTKIFTQSGEHSNPFQNALQQAITEDEMIIPSSVTQLYILAPMKLRLVTLSALIIERCVKPGSGKMLIFMATQDMIDYHCELLSRVLTGKKPNHIHIEEKADSIMKRSKKYMQKSKKDSEKDIDNQEQDPKDGSNLINDEDKRSKMIKNETGDDDYEYNFDSMDLNKYEEKMRLEKAYVNVEFFQLHGSMNQKTRTQVFNTFRKATSGVLLCTTKPLPKRTKMKLFQQRSGQSYKNKIKTTRKLLEPKRLVEYETKLAKYKRAREKIKTRGEIVGKMKRSTRKMNKNLQRKMRKLRNRVNKHYERSWIDCPESICDDNNYDCYDSSHYDRIDFNQYNSNYIENECDIDYDNSFLRCDSGNIESHISDSRNFDSCKYLCDHELDFFKLDNDTDESMDVCNVNIVEAFNNSPCAVLFCTDVAARGLDLPHVDCIVQYTGPISATDYVHRVGRTARAGNVGMAVMILLPSEVEFIRQLEKKRIRIHQEDMEVSHGALLRNTTDSKKPSQKHGRGGGPSPVQLAAAELQRNYEEMVKSDRELYIKACKAFTSWLRFYSTYPREARTAFDRKAIHMGHAATALALSDTPKKIGKEAPKPVNRKDTDLKRRAEKEKHLPKIKPPSAKEAKREKRMLVSEYESGLEPPKKKGKKST